MTFIYYIYDYIYLTVLLLYYIIYIGTIKPLVDPEVESEYNRHRDFLKKSVQELQGDYEEAILKRLEANKTHLKSNMSLLTEINQQKNINTQLKKTIQAMMGSIRQANQSYQKHRKLDLNRSQRSTSAQSLTRQSSLTKFLSNTAPAGPVGHGAGGKNKPNPNAFSFTTYYTADGTAVNNAANNNSHGNNNNNNNGHGNNILNGEEQFEDDLLDNNNNNAPSAIIEQRDRRILALKDTIEILQNEIYQNNNNNNTNNNNNDMNDNLDDLHDTESDKEQQQLLLAQSEQDMMELSQDEPTRLDPTSNERQSDKNSEKIKTGKSSSKKESTDVPSLGKNLNQFNESILSMTDSIDNLAALSLSEPFVNLPTQPTNTNTNTQGNYNNDSSATNLPIMSSDGNTVDPAPPLSGSARLSARPLMSSRGILSARISAIENSRRDSKNNSNTN